MRAALLRLHSGITLTGTLVVHLRVDAFGLVLVPPLTGYICIDDGVLGTSLCGSVSSLKKAFYFVFKFCRRFSDRTLQLLRSFVPVSRFIDLADAELGATIEVLSPGDEPTGRPSFVVITGNDAFGGFTQPPWGQRLREVHRSASRLRCYMPLRPIRAS